MKRKIPSDGETGDLLNSETISASADDQPVINNVGTVIVKVTEVELVRKKSYGFQFKRAPPALATKMVLPEGSKRLGALKVGYGRCLSHAIVLSD